MLLRMELSAARFFPFAPIESMVEPPDRGVTDRDDQAAASADVHANRIRVLQARPLWWLPPIAIVLMLSQVIPLIVGIGVIIAAVVAIRLLYRAADRRRDRVREADERIGIPVPADLGPQLQAVSAGLMQLGEYLQRSSRQEPGLAAATEPYRKDIVTIDRDYVSGLHDIRRQWVADDIEGWRSSTLDAVRHRSRTDEIVQAIREDLEAGGAEHP
jgi:hypothetical protein